MAEPRPTRIAVACRDCGLEQRATVAQYMADSQPRCYVCGGLVDPSADDDVVRIGELRRNMETVRRMVVVDDGDDDE